MPICSQSALLVCPTTLTKIYWSARAAASCVEEMFSICLGGRVAKKSFTCSGALSNSAFNKYDAIIVNYSFITALKKGIVSPKNCLSNWPPTTDVSI